MKRTLLVTVLFIFSLSILHAQQEDDQTTTAVTTDEVLLKQYFEANGLGQWQHKFDISSLPKGVYNLVVKGIDNAGNEIEAEAIDIRIDPKSDLPTVSISYPTQNAVVPGSVTILGSAVDDDAISFVEVRMGDSEYVRAEGTDYWAAELSAAHLEDGQYTITARASDIHGTVGEERSTVFHYNKYAPQISLLSHANGDLVSGKLELSGTVSDGNGLSSFFYSLDEGETFIPVSLKGKAREGNGEFSFSVDTKKNGIPDGPQIIILKAHDMRGGTGTAAYLLYIDNSDPVLEFLYPAPDAVPNGVFSIIGRATDEVGIASLSYSYKGGEQISIPLLPGNPFWSIEVDFRRQKSAELSFVIKDIAGNTRSVSYRSALDPDADLPVVNLEQPLADVPMTHKRLQGWVLDDDGPKGIVYSIDNDEEIRHDSGRSFDIDLSSLTAGVHTLNIRGVDKHDVEGNRQVVRFTVAPDTPVISSLEFVSASGEAVAYQNGMNIDVTHYPRLRGKIGFSGGNGKASYLLPRGDVSDLALKKSDSAGEFLFEITFPESVPFGFFPLQISAEDVLGSRSEYTARFWMKNLSVNQSEHGIFSSARTVIVNRDRNSFLRYVGYPLEKVEFDPPVDFARVEEKNGLITVSALSSGQARGVRIKARSVKGVEFLSAPLTVISDSDSPVISFDQDPSGQKGGRFSVSGRVSDDSGLPDVVYALAGSSGISEERTVPVSADEANGTFSFSLDADNLDPGGSTLVVTARDGAGHSSRIYAAFMPESAPGSAKMFAIAPAVDMFPETNREGSLFVAAGIVGLDEVQSVAVSLNGGEAVSMDGFPVATASLPMPGPGNHSLSFVAEYAGKKKITATKKFTVAGILPAITALGTASGMPFIDGMDIVREDSAVLSGTVSGINTFSVSEYSLNADAAQSLKLAKSDSGNTFSVPLDRLSYGMHTLSLRFVDSFGRELAQSVSFYLTASSSDRLINDNEGIYPLFETSDVNVVQDALEFYFHGRAAGNMELKSGKDILSLTQSGSVIRLVKSGSGRVDDVSFVITTIDGDSFTHGPFSVSTDTTAPELVMNSLDKRRYFSSSIPVSGTLSDDLAIDGIKYSLRGGDFVDLPLVTISEQGASPVDENRRFDFSANIPLDGIEDGLMSLRLKVADTSGNNRVYEYFLVKDSKAPVITQILPASDESVNGLVSLFVEVLDEWAENYTGVYQLGENANEYASGVPVLEVASDLSVFTELPEKMLLSLSDDAGNTGELVPVFAFDALADLPRVQIHIPHENAVIQETTTVSGTATDDDGIARIEYSIDDGEFIALPAGSSFEFNLDIEQLADNEHSLAVRAFDLNGVMSEPVVLNFRVSREIPVAEMTKPELGTTNKGVVTLEGIAEDKNGIDSVFISIDNGNSFMKARGTSEWQYELDSQVLTDGTYMVLIRVIDGYGIQGLYSSLVNIDNTAPKIELALPQDGDGFTARMPVQLRATDDIIVRRVAYRIEPLNTKGVAQADIRVLTGEFDPRYEVIIDSVDISGLAPGMYSFSLFAYDDALNESVVTRNMTVKIPDLRSVPKLLFPLVGSDVSGAFFLEGRIEGDHIPEKVSLQMNGTDFAVVDVAPSGYFYREILPGEIQNGEHVFKAVIHEAGMEAIVGADHELTYRKEGAWIQFKSIHLGSYVRSRPWIHGTAGYTYPDDIDPENLSRSERKSYEVVELEFSLDNGHHYISVKPDNEWKFRLETQDLNEGDLAVIIRVRFANGETAQARTLVFVDDTSPTITIVTPVEGKSLNDTIMMSGTAFDANGIANISVMIRKGSKNNYEVPQFIQGLYLDGHFMGATHYEAGLGLTFFDDNVKLQVLAGYAPTGRFNGYTFGLKLLANVATIPYGYYFGPDWDFLSSSIAVGSVFEYFSMTESLVEQDGLVLGAVVAQLELVKIRISGMKMFNTYSLYQENQLWFISSDIEGGLKYKFAFGVRIGVF